MYTPWLAEIETFQLLHTLAPLLWLLSASALILPTSGHHGNLIHQVVGATDEAVTTGSHLSLSVEAFTHELRQKSHSAIWRRRVFVSDQLRCSEFARLHFNTFFLTKLWHLNLDGNLSVQAKYAQLWTKRPSVQTSQQASLVLTLPYSVNPLGFMANVSLRFVHYC